MIPTTRDETPTLIYNPLKSDFTYPLTNDENMQIQYTMPSRGLVTFPAYIARHLAKHLAQKIALENTVEITKDGPIRLHYETRYQNALDKIFVKL